MCRHLHQHEGGEGGQGSGRLEPHWFLCWIVSPHFATCPLPSLKFALKLFYEKSPRNWSRIIAFHLQCLDYLSLRLRPFGAPKFGADRSALENSKVGAVRSKSFEIMSFQRCNVHPDRAEKAKSGKTPVKPLKPHLHQTPLFAQHRKRRSSVQIAVVMLWCHLVLTALREIALERVAWRRISFVRRFAWIAWTPLLCVLSCFGVLDVASMCVPEVLPLGLHGAYLSSATPSQASALLLEASCPPWKFFQRMATW